VLSPICAHSVVENQTIIFTIDASDPDGPSPLILSATDLPADAVFTDLGGGVGEFRWTPATDEAAGSPYNVTFTATDDDGAGLSDSETTLIFVTPAGASSNHLTAALSADNVSKVYVNGVVVCASSNWQAAKVFTVPLQHGANVVAIRGTDAGGVAGLLADLSWDGSTAVTDTGWKVSPTLIPGWESVGFDDSSWSFATSYGVYGVAPWLTRVVGFSTSSTAQWIWTDNNTDDDSAYLRYNITLGDPPPATPNMKMSADNASEFYVNGALVGTTSD
jgi:hypothetical protein